MSGPAQAPAEAFFLPTEAGRRFCLFHAPAAPCRGALLYVPPFAEEMNRARRMAAVQARALAAAGIGVLQIDLFGCGDSDGDFADASWAGWLADLAAASAWLRDRLGQPVGLWGLRLGARLALDHAARTDPAARLLLWQPALDGAAYLNQFLRLRLAADMLAERDHGGTAALRAALHAGKALEVGGYTLAPALAADLERLHSDEPAPRGRVDWLEMAGQAGRAASPAAQATAARWQAGGAELRLQTVAAAPFWSGQDIVVSDALCAATCALFGADDV